MNSHLLLHWRRPLSLLAVGILALGAGGVAAPAGGAAPAPAKPTWSAISPPVSPPPLAYAAMAYDSDNDTVVMFGGQGADGQLSSATWVWNGSTWAETSSAVPARDRAAMAFDPSLHQLILFGGQGAGGQALGDTWAWNGASWYALTPQTSPLPRVGPGLGFGSNDQLVLFGGTVVPTLSPSSSTAGAMPPTSTTAATPATTAAAPLVTGPATLGDTWVWTGSNWSQQLVNGPSARTNAAVRWDATQHQTVLLGGTTAPSDAPATAGLLGDTWVWSGGAWTQMTAPGGPSPRQGATLASDTDLGGLVAYGGATASGPAADTWLWTGQTWTQLAPTGSPGPREGAAASFDSAAHQLVLFGGISTGGTVVGGTEILTTKPPATPGGPSAGSGSPPAARTTPSTRRSSPATSTDPGTTRSASGALQVAPGSGQQTGVQGTGTVRRVRRGDLVTLTGSGYRPGTPITITFHSRPFLVGRTTAGADGNFTATVAVPTAASLGLHHFEATGLSAAGKLMTLITPIDVIGSTSIDRSLLQTLILVGVAVALPLGTWLLMVAVGRRRTPASPDPA